MEKQELGKVIGGALRALRESLTLSRRAIGDRQGVGYQRIANIERDAQIQAWGLLRWLDSLDADLYDFADAFYEQLGEEPERAKLLQQLREELAEEKVRAAKERSDLLNTVNQAMESMTRFRQLYEAVSTWNDKELAELQGEGPDEIGEPTTRYEAREIPRPIRWRKPA